MLNRTSSKVLSLLILITFTFQQTAYSDLSSGRLSNTLATGNIAKDQRPTLEEMLKQAIHAESISEWPEIAKRAQTIAQETAHPNLVAALQALIEKPQDYSGLDVAQLDEAGRVLTTRHELTSEETSVVRLCLGLDWGQGGGIEAEAEKLLRLAQNHFVLGEKWECISALHQILSVNPDHKEAYELLASVRKQLFESLEVVYMDPVKTHMALAGAAERMNLTEEVLYQYREVLISEPNHSEATAKLKELEPVEKKPAEPASHFTGTDFINRVLALSESEIEEFVIGLTGEDFKKLAQGVDVQYPYDRVSTEEFWQALSEKERLLIRGVVERELRQVTRLMSDASYYGFAKEVSKTSKRTRKELETTVAYMVNREGYSGSQLLSMPLESLGKTACEYEAAFPSPFPEKGDLVISLSVLGKKFELSPEAFENKRLSRDMMQFLRHINSSTIFYMSIELGGVAGVTPILLLYAKGHEEEGAFIIDEEWVSSPAVSLNVGAIAFAGQPIIRLQNLKDFTMGTYHKALIDGRYPTLLPEESRDGFKISRWILKQLGVNSSEDLTEERIKPLLERKKERTITHERAHNIVLEDMGYTEEDYGLSKPLGVACAVGNGIGQMLLEHAVDFGEKGPYCAIAEASSGNYEEARAEYYERLAHHFNYTLDIDEMAWPATVASLMFFSCVKDDGEIDFEKFRVLCMALYDTAKGELVKLVDDVRPTMAEGFVQDAQWEVKFSKRKVQEIEKSFFLRLFPEEVGKYDGDLRRLLKDQVARVRIAVSMVIEDPQMIVAEAQETASWMNRARGSQPTRLAQQLRQAVAEKEGMPWKEMAELTQQMAREKRRRNLVKTLQPLIDRPEDYEGLDVDVLKDKVAELTGRRKHSQDDIAVLRLCLGLDWGQGGQRIANANTQPILPAQRLQALQDEYGTRKSALFRKAAIENEREIIVPQKLIPENRRAELKDRVTGDVAIVPMDRAIRMVTTDAKASKRTILLSPGMEGELRARCEAEGLECKAKIVVLENYEEGNEERGFIFLGGGVVLARCINAEDYDGAATFYNLLASGEKKDRDEIVRELERGRLSVPLERVSHTDYRMLIEEAHAFLKSA